MGRQIKVASYWYQSVLVETKALKANREAVTQAVWTTTPTSYKRIARAYTKGPLGVTVSRN